MDTRTRHQHHQHQHGGAGGGGADGSGTHQHGPSHALKHGGGGGGKYVPPVVAGGTSINSGGLGTGLVVAGRGGRSASGGQRDIGVVFGRSTLSSDTVTGGTNTGALASSASSKSSFAPMGAGAQFPTVGGAAVPTHGRRRGPSGMESSDYELHNSGTVKALALTPTGAPSPIETGAPFIAAAGAAGAR